MAMSEKRFRSFVVCVAVFSSACAAGKSLSVTLGLVRMCDDVERCCDAVRLHTPLL